jgi:tripartite ATP-independent transporter DctM subunit
MSDLALALWSFPALLALILLRMPIGLAMFVTGAAGLWAVTGTEAILLARLKNETYSTFSNYALSIIPMFLLMGQFATLGGLSTALFRAADGLVGHRRGGVAMAAIGACAGFGAICGSSLATAATMGRVALPELRRQGYEGGFASATIAAGGTLGILIPPSVILVIYAILTEQNIAKLFLAALLPGLLAALGYALAIALYVRVNPGAETRRAALPWPERRGRLRATWPVLALFALVVGGIYGGVFTPTEAAAIGVLGTGLIAARAGGLSGRSLSESLIATARTTAMIFFIVLGAAIYNGFLAVARLPQEMSDWIAGQGFAPLTVLLVILAIYLLLGCLMDSLSMILLTVPIFFPVVMALDFGLTPEQTAIWFGILVLIVVEVGLITPPVGLNLFVIGAMDRTIPAGATWRAVGWFVGSDLVRVALLVAFPAVTVFLV